MGEKYDWESDFGSAIRIGPRVARFRDPTGPGFPPENYGVMRQWGDAGKSALSDFFDRPVAGIASMCNDSAATIRTAGPTVESKIAAGEQVVDRLNSGYRELQMQGAQAGMTLQMLNGEPTIPAGEPAQIARQSARKLRQAVTDHVGTLEQLAGEAFGAVHDRALNAVGEKVEAAANRVGQFVYNSSAGLSRQLLRGGTPDTPSPTDEVA